jgi:Uma2 family endonuclease
VLTAEQIAPVPTVPLTVEAYHRLWEAGFYKGHRVQLIYGTVVDMSPMGFKHKRALRVLNRYFVSHTPPEIGVQVQIPIDASEDSEPEPDFSFVPEGDDDATALLAVEVADSSLRLDVGPKARLYAETGIPEYWVVDLNAKVTLVHRTIRRARYTNVRKVPWSTVLASTSLPMLSVKFAELLR